jgi:hypothetical protein
MKYSAETFIIQNGTNILFFSMKGSFLRIRGVFVETADFNKILRNFILREK